MLGRYIERGMPTHIFLVVISFIAAANCFSSRGARISGRFSAGALQCTDGSSTMSDEFLLNDKEMLQFMRDGHLLKRGLINPGLITDSVAPSLLQLYDQNILTAWKHKLKLNLGMDSEAAKDLTVADCEKLLENIDKEEIPFMQLFNLWYASDDVRTLALSNELGRVAAQLLGINILDFIQYDAQPYKMFMGCSGIHDLSHYCIA